MREAEGQQTGVAVRNAQPRTRPGTSGLPMEGLG